MNALSAAQRFQRIAEFESLTIGGYESLLERIAELEAEVQAATSAKLESMLVMAEKIESLEAELATCRDDAERYRWLRQKESWIPNIDKLPSPFCGRVKWLGSAYSEDEIDALIDAARSNHDPD